MLLNFSALFQHPARGRVILVGGDGRIVSGQNIAFSANINSDEYASVLDALSTLQSRQTGYIVSEVRNQGETLIGFAGTGLKEDYPNLNWAVLVSQPTDETFAVIRTPELIIILLELVSKMVLWQREEKKEACEEKRLRETEEDLAI